jgi:hypothetical protein
MIHWIRTAWCKSMHNQAMWPIHGKYICPRCLQEYPISWHVPAAQGEYADPSLRHAGESVTYVAEHLSVN